MEFTKIFIKALLDILTFKSVTGLPRWMGIVYGVTTWINISFIIWVITSI